MRDINTDLTISILDAATMCAALRFLYTTVWRDDDRFFGAPGPRYQKFKFALSFPKPSIVHCITLYGQRMHDTGMEMKIVRMCSFLFLLGFLSIFLIPTFRL
jgi:hypothetical protein